MSFNCKECNKEINEAQHEVFGACTECWQGYFMKQGVEKSRSEEPIVLLDNVKVPVRVELGRAVVPIKEIRQYASGKIIELDADAGAPVTIYAGEESIAYGEVVTIDDKFGVRITEIIKRD